MLGEDHQLFARGRNFNRDDAGAGRFRNIARWIGYYRWRKYSTQKTSELPPLCIGTAAPYCNCERFEPDQSRDLDLELRHRARRRGLIQNLLFGLFQLV